MVTPVYICVGSVFVPCICVLSSFANILMWKRELVLILSFWCVVIVLWLFFAVPWVGLQCVVVVFPVRTHFIVWGKIFLLQFW